MVDAADDPSVATIVSQVFLKNHILVRKHLKTASWAEWSEALEAQFYM